MKISGTVQEKNSSLIHFAEKNNISYLVIEKDNDVHTNVHDKNMLKNQMMGYFLNQAQKESRILDSTEVYQINQSWDPWNQNYYVEMWGSLDDGSRSCSEVRWKVCVRVRRYRIVSYYI